MEEGTIPIILSAPHDGTEPIAGAAERVGTGVDRFVTVRDTNAALVVKHTADKLEKLMGGRPFVVTAAFGRKWCDANRDPKNGYESDAAKAAYDAYHGFLRHACKTVQTKWGRGLLLDIHGQASDREAVFRGTLNGKSVQRLTRQFGRAALTGPKGVPGFLASKGVKLIPACDAADQTETKFTGGFITEDHGSDKGWGIDAIQLETGGSQRTKAGSEKFGALLAEAVAAFAGEYLKR